MIDPQWATFGVLAVALVLFVTEWVAIDLVALLIPVVLGILGVLTPSEAFSGFGNGAVITVAGMFGADLFNTNVMTSIDTYETHFTNRLGRMIMVEVADGLDPVAARPAIEAVVAEFPNVEMSDADEYVDKVAGQVDAVLNIITALLAMAIVIALLPDPLLKVRPG